MPPDPSPFLPPRPDAGAVRFYLLVEAEAHRHPLGLVILAALGPVQVFAEFGQRHARLAVWVKHAGSGQCDEGVCHRAWGGGKRKSRSSLQSADAHRSPGRLRKRREGLEHHSSS